ncbi:MULTISPECIES: hypothetical protein [unclassified Paenibacillus]|uniref:hypothetical protein n=1 Tax=unclassified Paenibacillus TaxID=185978 RepID=UPI0030FA6D61
MKKSWTLLTISLAIISAVNYSLITNIKKFIFPLDMLTFWSPISLFFALTAIYFIRSSSKKTFLVTSFLCLLSTLACPYVWMTVVNYVRLGEFVTNSYWIKWQVVCGVIVSAEVYMIARIIYNSRKKVSM